MLYIENKNNTETRDKFKDNQLEFCISLKQKPFFSNYKICSSFNENMYFLYNDKQFKFCNHEGNVSRIYMCRALSNENMIVKNNNLKDSFKTVEESSLANANWDIVNDFNKDLDGFSKLQTRSTIKDNNGEEYLLSVYKNVDQYLRVPALNDILILEKDSNIVGRMIVQYTNDEIINQINDNPQMFSYCSNKSKAPFFSNKKDFEKYITDNDIKFNDNLVDTESFKTLKKTVKGFHNKAFIEYSELDVYTDLRGKGLGSQMYFHMSQQLNKSNIELYSSQLLNELSSRLWEKLEIKFKDQITKKKIFNNENPRYCLVIPENMSYPFDKNKKERKVKIKKM